MSNYNTQLQSNNTDLQEVLELLQTKATGGITPSGTITMIENGTYDVKSYASAVVNVANSGGNSDIEDALLNKTISTYTNNRVTSIGDYAFYKCFNLTSVSIPSCSRIGSNAFWRTNLTSVSFPNCRDIDSHAFYYCTNLTSVNFPVCSRIGNSAFYYCTNLTSVNFPVCSRIGNSAFYYCYSLTSVSFPMCTSIGRDAFNDCSKLTSVNFPVCSYIGSNAFWRTNLTSVSFPNCRDIDSHAFYSCTKLTSVSFPNCSYISDYAFGYCFNLTSVSFPVCTSIENFAFGVCTKLTSVSFPSCTRIRSSAFYGCRTLSSITLGASTVCTLSNSNAFTNTPYAGYSVSFSGTPYIHVPLSLVDAYKTATNWTYFSSYFSSIESLSGPNLITFTIDETEYQAEEGMTWAEWCDSEYCNNLWSAAIGDNYNYIVNAPGALEINGTSSFDIIEPGYNYTTKVHGNF